MSRPSASDGPHHFYRGHRSYSFTASDVNELVELRARQRTFHGAYSRTALANLGYSLTILRLFDHRFHKSEPPGRLRRAVRVFGVLHDFADHEKSRYDGRVLQTKGQHGKRVFGRPFVSAGRVVVLLAMLVLGLEISLLVLLLDV
ncbi:hypothetical protein BD626DRAFT_495940 [Schizophyllum amplum]|uniref:Uncharacterized protein n=1 Tax=Schizophyllum amplum TaxID=97359 RepID=A0A550CEJ4_9AGAR|nr:hypothetical protein BD626DRAFT_495940 [Auriculariopsis ampla]